MVLCDVCNHAIWKYPVWDCSRYFSILTGNVRPVASGTSRDTADRCHRLRSHLQVVVELMICSDTGLFIINGGRNSYDPVEILAKKLRKLNETNILVITILESQKLS